MECSDFEWMEKQEGEISGISMKKLQEWLHRWVDIENMYKKEVEGSYCGQEVSGSRILLMTPLLCSENVKAQEVPCPAAREKTHDALR
jgi:hypothetical protein